MVIFETLDFHKIDFTENLSSRKIAESPYCPLAIPTNLGNFCTRCAISGHFWAFRAIFGYFGAIFWATYLSNWGYVMQLKLG